MICPPQQWNAKTDKHITTGGSAGARDGHITTHLVQKGAQEQAKMYIPQKDR